MAGTNSAFDAVAFRQAIKSAMVMGAPVNQAERATFRWKPVRDYAIDDPAQNPYDWTATPETELLRPDKQVDCAVEFRPRTGDSNAMGQFDPSQATITLLDTDYEQVKGANQVILGGNTYQIDFTGPPMGLFSVTVYQMHLTALDEA